MKWLKGFFVLPPGGLGSNLIICRQNAPKIEPEAQGFLVKHSKMVDACNL